MKNKFKFGDTVAYAGPNRTLRTCFTQLTVTAIVHPGEPIGNSETNKSGKNLYQCRSNHSGVLFLFLEDELAPAETATGAKVNADELAERYKEIEKEYKEALLHEIKDIIILISTNDRDLGENENPTVILTQDALDAFTIDSVYKFNTSDCDGSADNIELTEYVINNISKADSRLEVTGESDDGCARYTFFEDEFDIRDLEEIRLCLCCIREGIDDGYLQIDESGRIDECQYALLCVFDSKEDVDLLKDKEVADIFTDIVMGEGDSKKPSLETEVTRNDLDIDLQYGKYKYVHRDGRVIVALTSAEDRLEVYDLID